MKECWRIIKYEDEIPAIKKKKKQHLLVKLNLKMSRENKVENNERKWKWRKMVKKRWENEIEKENCCINLVWNLKCVKRGKLNTIK